MRCPFLLIAALLDTGHNYSNDQGNDSLIQPSFMKCHGTMREADGIVSYLKEEYSSRYAKTYLITGATSGIGLEAAKMLAIMNPLNRIFVVGRNTRKARMAAEEIASVHPEPALFRENVVPIVCDQSSFESVRRFSRELRSKLDETYDPKKWEANGIDALCLNAAVLQPNDVPAQFTEDDIEITFQTNHLSPFLLINLIHGTLNPGGRVVVSSSGLHLYQKLLLEGLIDPETGRARRGFETADGAEYNCKKTYAFSKLCNVAMAIELQERLRRMGIAVLSFSPGLITSTNLFRHHRKNNNTIQFPRDIMANEKTIQWGAGALVYMATAGQVGKTGGKYWHDPNSGAGPCAIYGKEFRPSDVPDSHISVAGRKKLWSLSCDLAGVAEDTIPLHSERLANAD